MLSRLLWAVTLNVRDFFSLSFSLFEALAKSETLIDAIQTAVGCQVQQDVHLPPGEVLMKMMIVVLLLVLAVGIVMPIGIGYWYW